MNRRTWSVVAGILTGVLCLLLVARLSSSEETARRDDLARETQVVAHQFSTRLRNTLEKHLLALEQVASFFENSEVVTDTEFQTFCSVTLKRIPGCLRLGWVDASLHIRMIHPAEPNRALIGVDTRVSPEGSALLEEARLAKEARFSRPLRLLDGPRGFLLAVPIFKGGRFDGEIVGTFRGADFVSTLSLPAVLQRYEEVVLDSGGSLLPGPLPEQPPMSERPSETSAFSLAGVPWEVRVTPRLDVVEDRLHSGTAAFWTLGVMLALLAGGAVGWGAYAASGLAGRVRAQDAALRQTRESLDGARQQLIQADKLSALGELVAGVAHEINNPLASIMGYLQLLQARELPPEVRRRIETVYSEAERMARIVKNLLTFGRKHKPEKRYLGLNGIIEKTLELKAYHFRVNHVRVETDLAPNLPMTMLDFHQVQQVLVNLLSNAEHAMAEAGCDGVLTISTRAEGGRIEVRVRDNGPGIPPEIQTQIFEPFFTTKKDGKGTGLGLSLCYGILKEHGGGIHVESRPGHGATFVLDFPILEPPEPDRRTAGAAAGQPRRLRVLVVDAEQPVSDFLVELLTSRGHRVNTAADLPEALQKIAREEHDLIISDMKMPSGTGRDIYRAALAKASSLARRIVFTTGAGMSEETQKFVREIGAPVLEKPCTIGEIERAIGRATGGPEPAPVRPESPSSLAG